MPMESAADTYRVRIGAWVKARLLRNPNALRIDCEGLDLFVVRDVVSAADCAAFIEMIDADLSPSLLMGPPPDPEFRTSQSCNLDPHHPRVQMLEQSIRAVVGIQPELGETVQGQRYTVGQQFKPHWDYFLTSESYWPVQQLYGGQRTWTAMLFLNEPEAGGHTIFTEVGVTVRPRAGNLLVWNNLTPEGELNTRSMHQGSPVTAGSKYVITKWHRERRWVSLPAEQLTS
jgi:prolyl 4-hydroxylase